MKLFHISIYWPINLPDTVTREQGIPVTPTAHALERAVSKGFRCPRVIPAGAKCIEAEMSGVKLTKLVLRFSYDKTRDVVVVVRDGVLITAWLNDKSDSHGTLDRSKYARTA